MVAVEVLVGGVIAVLVGVFALYLLIERDAGEASRKTSERAVGVTAGAGSAGVAAATVGVETVAQLPELALTALGIGAIMSGVSWEMFAALAVVVYLVAETLNGGPREV